MQRFCEVQLNTMHVSSEVPQSFSIGPTADYMDLGLSSIEFSEFCFWINVHKNICIPAALNTGLDNKSFQVSGTYVKIYTYYDQAVGMLFMHIRECETPRGLGSPTIAAWEPIH